MLDNELREEENGRLKNGKATGIAYGIYKFADLLKAEGEPLI